MECCGFKVFKLVETKLRSPWGEADTKTSASQANTKDMLVRLEKFFAFDARMGNLRGTDKLLEQLRYYAQYFGDSKIRLKRVDELVPSVLVASAVFSFTISEITLFTVFPVLARALQERGSSQLKLIAKCLLGKRLDCSCLMTFYFDDEIERVMRVGTNIDWIGPLFSVLGNLDDVRRVLEDAVITRECIICP